MSARNPAPEFMMPVSEEGAAMQFFIEAMKQNTETMRQIGESLKGVQAEQKETLRLVHDTRERVIRMESGGVSEDIAEIKKSISKSSARIEALEADKNRRDGAWRFAAGIREYGPILIVILTALFVVLVATRRIVLP